MNSYEEKVKNIQAIKSFRDRRSVYEGGKPSLLMPLIYADVVYDMKGLKPLYINHAKIYYSEGDFGLQLTIEELMYQSGFFAEFKTSFQHFQYDDANDTLTITGEAFDDVNKKYKVLLS